MTVADRPPFHLAVTAADLEAARAFYGGVLGCPEGRSAADWIDFDFFGHQLVCHRGADEVVPRARPVDGHAVPVPHFGVVLELEPWERLRARLAAANVAFAVAPHMRFVGTPGEQATFFVRDPAGHALEFKAFRDVPGRLFAR